MPDDSRLLFNRYWQDNNISSIGLKLKPNADAATLSNNYNGYADLVAPRLISIRSAKAFVNFLPGFCYRLCYYQYTLVGRCGGIYRRIQL